MKKLTITLLFLSALICGGCKQQTQEQIDADMTSNIAEFTYKGHRYILFYEYYGQPQHAPDCPCHEKGGEK